MFDEDVQEQGAVAGRTSDRASSPKRVRQESNLFMDLMTAIFGNNATSITEAGGRLLERAKGRAEEVEMIDTTVLAIMEIMISWSGPATVGECCSQLTKLMIERQFECLRAGEPAVPNMVEWSASNVAGIVGELKSGADVGLEAAQIRLRAHYWHLETAILQLNLKDADIARVCNEHVERTIASYGAVMFSCKKSFRASVSSAIAELYNLQEKIDFRTRA